MRQRLSIAAAAAGTALCFAPGSAFGLDTFVDADAGIDANNCTQATPGGAGVGPCLTVQAAVDKAGPSGGTVRIDRGDTFPEAVTLGGGVSLTGQDLEPSDTGPAIVDGGAQTALYVPPANTAGTIEGLTLRGNGYGVLADGSLAQVTQNVFDDPTGDSNGVGLTGASTLVNLNTFTGDGASFEIGVYLTDGAATIRDNTFTGHHAAIQVNGTGGAGPTATPAISGNSIMGVHQMGSSGTGILALSGTNATIAGNRICTRRGSVRHRGQRLQRAGHDRRDAAAKPGVGCPPERHRHPDTGWPRP